MQPLYMKIRYSFSMPPKGAGLLTYANTAAVAVVKWKLT